MVYDLENVSALIIVVLGYIAGFVFDMLTVIFWLIIAD